MTPTNSTPYLSTPYLEQVFGAGGLFAAAFPGYEPRPGQIAMAEAINRSIREGEPLLVEAPTGTGKSFSYLVPLIWHLTEGREAIIAGRLGGHLDADPDGEDTEEDAEEDADEYADEYFAENPYGADPNHDGDPEPPPRALVVTANIALQEQLFLKDIPTLQRILPWRFTAALAKGCGNYLCLDRQDEAALEESTFTSAERGQWGVIKKWSAATRTGDLSELPFELLPSLRPRLTITSDDCTKKACPHYNGCHAERARRAVSSAQIIVTNYHLLFAHLALQAEGAPGILPSFDLVAFDEAHAAADIARDFFGVRITPGKVRAAARLLIPSAKKNPRKAPLPPLDPELQRDVRTLADRFFEDLDALRRSPNYRARITAPNAVPWAELAASLVATAKVYDAACENPALQLDDARKAELERASRRARILEHRLRHAMRMTDPNEVPYLEEATSGAARGATSAGGTVLCSRLIQVGAILEERLFDAIEIRAVVATSATLTTGPGEAGFAFARRELGAGTGARVLATPSPFDHAQQCLLVVPEGLPDPKARDYAEQIATWVVRVVELAGGRTLGLFTSRRALLAAAELLRAELARTEIRARPAGAHRFQVLVQGEAPRTQLIRRFREDVTSVLLGTKSFWAGVDVPGESLSCVVIDRIPFETPDDPILDALSARSANTFRDYSVPRAAIELRQGVGRLIRTSTDRGAVVILDRRIVDTSYGRSILAALPPARRSRRLEDIAVAVATGRETTVSVSGMPQRMPPHQPQAQLQQTLLFTTDVGGAT